MQPVRTHQTAKFTLQGLDCASCAAKIEVAVQREMGLSDAAINFAARTIFLPPQYAPKVQEIIDRIEPGVVLVAAEEDDGAGEDDDASDGLSGDYDAEEAPHKTRVTEIAVAASLMVLGLVFHTALQRTPYAAGEYAVFLSAYWLVGRHVVAAAFRNFRHGNFFDENALMTVATVGAFLIGELPEAVGVMLFYSIGEELQDRAVDRSRRSIKNLLDVRPETARVLRNGAEHTVAPENVRVGERVLVRPGEKVPLDGTVAEGTSFVDTSALTGESVPRRVVPGDTVLAGSVNGQGLLTVTVAKPFAESSVSRILELVERAGARKARTERFITQFSRYYTPAVAAIALGVALLPPLLLPGAQLSEWVYRALVLLVISCPCALVLSIPLGYFGGIGGAARSGILVKGANFLDVLTQLDTVVFDKTGTLTQGVFRVQQIAAVNGFSQDEVLEYAALAESFSNHPIAASIVDAYGKEPNRSRVDRYEEIPGQGVVAHVDGRPVALGNARLLRRFGITEVQTESTGTVVHVAIDGRLAGTITIADEVKADAAQAVGSLRRLGVRRTVMLTGDRAEVARSVATDLAIDEVYAELLPEDKVEIFERIAAKGNGRVAFVGDGINDAPVLTRADVGIAMGALGSDAAIEAADVVIMDDAPTKVARAVEIARRTRSIVWQNIALALAVKGIVLALGAFGLTNMWQAVFADVGVALLAVMNATRALRA